MTAADICVAEGHVGGGPGDSLTDPSDCPGGFDDRRRLR
jgi:hypothetical protein